MTTARQIRLLAEHLDANGKPEQPITVVGTRAHLRRAFKPEKRGGVLRVGLHELQLVPCAEPAPLQNLDWVGDEAPAP